MCSSDLAKRVPTNDLRAILRALPHEWSLFGVWSGDYRRAVLYLPDELLRIAPDGSLAKQRFAFPEPAPGWSRQQLPPAAPRKATDDFRPGEYAPRVARAIEHLRRGDLSSLVLSQSFRRKWSDSAAKAFQALRRNNPHPVMFYARLPDGETVFGASPDMQLRLRDGVVESAPVCGTLRRGGDAAEDAARLKELILSPKEESSLAACSDADLVDKAEVCVPGTLELVARRKPMFLATILHTVDLTRGRVRPDKDALDVLFAHVAPATIAGFPKGTALRLIAELEASPRGWYGGAVVRLGADGSLDAGTILRAAAIGGGVAEIRTGGGLMPDADPLREEAETYLKAESLFRALGLAPPSPPPALPLARLDPPVTVQLETEGDPQAGPLRDLFARIGAVDGRGGVFVTSGARPVAAARFLAIGEAATMLLGGEVLTPAWSAVRHRVRCEDFLRGIDGAAFGFYATRALRRENLPDGWRAVAITESGFVAAAARRDGRAAALFFRPESVVSRERDAGAGALVLALRHLDNLGDPT